MSFDKNYPKRKDWRKQYRGAKSIDKSCRNHGNCEWCRRNRTFRSKKIKASSIAELKYFIKGYSINEYLPIELEYFKKAWNE